MPRLRIIASGTERVVPLAAVPISMGRSSDNLVILDDTKSSRRHCIVEALPDGTGWRVRDLHSMNGTYVNGIPITERRLGPGDKIEIGKTEIRFEPEEAPGAHGPGAPANADARTEIPVPDRGVTRVGPRRLLGPTGEETIESLREEVSTLHRLLAINKSLTSELRLDKLLEIIVDTAIHLTDAERGFLLLTERSGLEFRVSRTFRQETLPKPETEISHSIAAKVIESGEPVLTADAQADDRFRGLESVRDLQLRSVLCVPLRASDEVNGAIYLDNHVERGLFRPQDVDLTQAFAAQAAIALNNARLVRDNELKHRELESSYRRIEELNRELAAKVDLQTQELLAVRVVQEDLKAQLGTKYNYDKIVGKSPKMQEIFRLLDRITDVTVPVLIYGESGTGKELIARAIHYNGPRKAKPFVSENCAAISETLLESELFGYVRGAFTGAERNKKGLFEIATGGTLFLDEVGDMSLDMQKKLLRVLQEGQIRPVGGKDTINVDVRILSATNKRLEDLIREGRFREDLYYRLNVVTIQVPPLRERREDITPLVQRFLELATEPGQPAKRMHQEVVSTLIKYDWPGNVRELENEIRKMVALAPTDTIDMAGCSTHVREGTSLVGGKDRPTVKRAPIKEMIEEMERQEIGRALAETRGNKSAAAKALGLSRLGLRKKMERYKIQ